MKIIYHMNVFEKVCDAYHVSLKLGRDIKRITLTTEEYDEFYSIGRDSQWNDYIRIINVAEGEPRKLRFDYIVIEEEL